MAAKKKPTKKTAEKSPPKKRGGKSPGVRGKGFERELVNLAKANDPAVVMARTYGSDGRSRGLDRRVDLVIDGQHFIIGKEAYGQSKRAKKLPSYFDEIYEREIDSADCIIFYAEGRYPLVAMKWSHLMSLLSGTYVEFDIVTENRNIGALYSPVGDTISFQVFRGDFKKHEIIITMELQEAHNLFPKLQNLPIL